MAKVAKKHPVKRGSRNGAGKSKPSAMLAGAGKSAAAAFGKLLDNSSARDWLAFASLQRGRLVREVRDLGEEIVSKIAHTPVFCQRDELIREARNHIDALLGHLHGGSLVNRALHKARQTQTELLSILNIPSQKELAKLQKKLNQIEARLGTMGRKTPPSSSTHLSA